MAPIYLGKVVRPPAVGKAPKELSFGQVASQIALSGKGQSLSFVTDYTCKISYL